MDQPRQSVPERLPSANRQMLAPCFSVRMIYEGGNRIGGTLDPGDGRQRPLQHFGGESPAYRCSLATKYMCFLKLQAMSIGSQSVL